MYYSTLYQSPIGELVLACKDETLVGVWMKGNAKNVGLEKTIANNDCEVFGITKKWFDRYFAGKNPPIKGGTLAPIGGAFFQEVWGFLREIPYGEVTTYGDISRKVAKKRGKLRMSSRAVGQAVGHNPIAIIMPCHRVIGSNGSLTGFAFGIPTKIKLLELEGVDVSKFSIPVDQMVGNAGVEPANSD